MPIKDIIDSGMEDDFNKFANKVKPFAMVWEGILYKLSCLGTGGILFCNNTRKLSTPYIKT